MRVLGDEQPSLQKNLSFYNNGAKKTKKEIVSSLFLGTLIPISKKCFTGFAGSDLPIGIGTIMLVPGSNQDRD